MLTKALEDLTGRINDGIQACKAGWLGEDIFGASQPLPPHLVKAMSLHELEA